VDPWAIGGRMPGQRTIGGMIATNALGPLRWSAGDWRLFVMGMKWVNAQGEVISGGGRTVKNVAGYSTPRMMIGSGGSLGVIGEVTLRTFARPRDEQCVLLFCGDAMKAEALLAEIFTAPVSAAYLQVVSGATFRGNPLQLPTARTGVVVIAGFMDRPAVCAAQIEVVRGLAAAQGMESIAQTAAQAGRLRLWMTSEPTLGEGVRFCVHALSSQVCGLVSEIAALDREKVWVVSEAGTGVVRGTIARADGANALAAIVGHHAGAVADVFSATAAQTGANASSDIGGRLKSVLDPRGLFGQLRSA
jgi:FAD/FMN-containing dehydrogenase